MDKRWSLNGKYALVTGGTKGIGKAIALEFMQLGAKVGIVSRTKEDISIFLEEYKTYNPLGIVEDLSDPLAAARIFKIVEKEWGMLDILVNNVGMNIRKKVIEYSSGEYDRIVNTNMRSAYEMSKTFYPFLKNSGKGSIVNISSTAGQTHLRTGAIYGMTKAAMIQLSKNLAGEWGKDNIRVNTVAPWYIETPLAMTVLKDEDYKKEVLSRTPLNRIGKPEEVAATAAFLCMPAAAYITGQCVSVDGGFLIKGF